jgi:hypothetical protein
MMQYYIVKTCVVEWSTSIPAGMVFTMTHHVLEASEPVGNSDEEEKIHRLIKHLSL